MTHVTRSTHSEFQIRARRVGSVRPLVRFEPTPAHVVTVMLEFADVKRRDVVYDLGCGDGRIAIAAARRFGAQGVGVENHAGRVAEATRNARVAGVASRVQFLQQDLFETDLRPATVVTLFLLPEANVMLRPKMLRELAPGSRIVSYIHEMGSWKPDKAHYTLDRTGRYHRIYLWTVPAPGAAGMIAPRSPPNDA